MQKFTTTKNTFCKKFLVLFQYLFIHQDKLGKEDLDWFIQYHVLLLQQWDVHMNIHISPCRCHTEKNAYDYASKLKENIENVEKLKNLTVATSDIGNSNESINCCPICGHGVKTPAQLITHIFPSEGGKHDAIINMFTKYGSIPLELIKCEETKNAFSKSVEPSDWHTFCKPRIPITLKTLKTVENFKIAEVVIKIFEIIDQKTLFPKVPNNKLM